MKNNIFKICSVFSFMMTSSIIFAPVSLQEDSPCLGQSAEQREYFEAMELINQVQKKIKAIYRQPKLEERQWRNQQGDVILSVPSQYILNIWEIPLKSGLQKFAGTELELLVPYVLKEMVFLPTPTEVFRRKIESRSKSQLIKTEYVMKEVPIFHQWKKTLDDRLIYKRWVDGEVDTIASKKYQCRQGRIVCEDDLDIAKEVSFKTYEDTSRLEYFKSLRL